MSKVLGIPDFRDFLEQEGIHYCKKLKIYLGYMNYILDEPIDTSSFNLLKDWAYYFHNTIITKSLYKNLGEGYVVLSDRDYVSIQQDKNAGNGYNERARSLNKMRLSWEKETQDIGLSKSETQYIVAYRPQYVKDLVYEFENTK